MHHAERKRRICAGADSDVPVGHGCRARAVRIDHDQTGSVAARFFNKRPKMNVVAVDVRAPGKDELGKAGNLPLSYQIFFRRPDSTPGRRPQNRSCGRAGLRPCDERSGDPLIRNRARRWFRRSCTAESDSGPYRSLICLRRMAIASRASSQLMRSKESCSRPRIKGPLATPALRRSG